MSPAERLTIIGPRVLSSLLFQSKSAVSFQWKGISFDSLIHLGIIVVIAVAVRWIARWTASRLLKGLNNASSGVQLRRRQQLRTLADLVVSAVTALTAVFVVIAGLGVFGVDIRLFAAAVGLMSLAVGFGGQYFVRDIINGMVIIFEDQYAVGEKVHIGDVTGEVEHLTLRRTVVRTEAGALVTIPNGTVSEVFNLSRDWSRFTVEIVVTETKQGVDRAGDMLKGIVSGLAKDPTWKSALVGTPEMLGLESFTGSTATFRIEGRTAPGKQQEVVQEIQKRIRMRFTEANIGIQGVQTTAA